MTEGTAHPVSGAGVSAGAALFPMPWGRSSPFDPPLEYARWRASDEPVRRVRTVEGHVAWLLTRYADLRAVLADRRFSSAETSPGYPTPQPGATLGFPGNFMLMDPPRHTELRRILSAEFHATRIEALRPEVQRITDDLIDRILQLGPPVDLVANFALPLPSLTICRLLGVPAKDRDFFQGRAEVIASASAPPEEVMAAYRDLGEFLRGLLADKGTDPGDDLLSRLAVDQVRPGRVTMAEAIGMTQLLLVGGHETTSSMIGVSAVALLAHPKQRDALIFDSALAGNAADELLRYLSTVQFGLRRTATEDVRIGEVTIREGEGVVIPLQAANRDPAVFDDPDRLDLARPRARHHLAFGHGIHLCIGHRLARLEIEVAMSTLFRRLPGLRLAIGFAEVSFRPEALDYCVADLPVAW